MSPTADERVRTVSVDGEDLSTEGLLGGVPGLAETTKPVSAPSRSPALK
jgi:hypothetical protein